MEVFTRWHARLAVVSVIAAGVATVAAHAATPDGPDRSRCVFNATFTSATCAATPGQGLDDSGTWTFSPGLCSTAPGTLTATLNGTEAGSGAYENFPGASGQGLLPRPKAIFSITGGGEKHAGSVDCATHGGGIADVATRGNRSGYGCDFTTTTDRTTPNKPNTQIGEVNAGPMLVVGATSVTLKCMFKVGASLTTAPTVATATETNIGSVGVLDSTLSFTVKPGTNVFLCTDIGWTNAAALGGNTTSARPTPYCAKATAVTTGVCTGDILSPTVCAPLDTTLTKLETAAPPLAPVIDTVEHQLGVDPIWILLPTGDYIIVTTP